MQPPGPQHGLSQSQSQQQNLSPQMRQSLEVLQSSTMELSQLINQIAEMNPTLEISEDIEQLDNTPEPDAEHDLENLSEFDDTWREDQILAHGSSQASTAGEALRDFIYNSIVEPKTLQQHLIDQLNRSAVDNDRHAAAEHLIGYINNQGFLDDDIDTLVTASPYTIKQLRSAQTLIQGFDPAGVAAENLTESLLLQLQLTGRGNSLESRIVDQHLTDLARHKYSDIARNLGVTQASVVEAADNISKLNPNPGVSFDSTSNPHVLPDLEIRKDIEGSYYAHLTNESIPTLRISNHYKDLLAKINTDSKARKFLRENIHESRQIMNAVSQRQETLLKIGVEIILHQSEFLKYGRGKLRPMTMHSIADKVGVHAATISRAVSGKYILTPHGLMELRTFFSSGYTTNQGTEISNTGVRDAIQHLVNDEDTAKPLSDTAIEKQLKTKGIKVARRTIAKYRDQLGILPSHLRKRHS